MRLAQALFTALLLALGGMASAQSLSLGTPVIEGVRSPILIVDLEAAFAQSAFGRRVSAELEAFGQTIAEENRAIEAELVAEERELTEARSTMENPQFRQLAEAFNAKVERLRSEQDEKARALGERSDTVRRSFVEAARPVLTELMQEAGAAVIVEKRSVFLAADAVDITQLAIRRIDLALGDGATLPEQTEQD